MSMGHQAEGGPDPALLEAAAGDQDSFRDVVRAWMHDNVPAAWLEAALGNDMARLHEVRSPDQYREWYPTLGRSGLIGSTWPVEYGGLGAPPPLAAVAAAELRRARLTTLNVVGVALAAPTLLRWGTPDQCARMLPAIAQASELWCQLFSEPGAGSDLAGLSSRASADGGDWLVDGQKVWSSFASEAAYGILLARTDPEVPKHQGITAFALRMDQPGVTVRPLRKISGDAEFNEVFLDHARVPDQDRIGPVGSGWDVARTVLANERAMLSGAGSGLRERTSGSSVERLIELASQGEPGSRIIDDPVQADAIARLYIENQVVRMTNERARALRGTAGAAPAMLKVMASEHNQRLQMLMLDLIGIDGLAYEPGDTTAERTVFGFLRSRGDTIGGGTSEVQRNNVAERVLGLPKDPFSDNSVPWKDIKRGP
jgi:alkylation response protein AidB-like acyl-CoA dehydrogenase